MKKKKKLLVAKVSNVLKLRERLVVGEHHDLELLQKGLRKDLLGGNINIHEPRENKVLLEMILFLLLLLLLSLAKNAHLLRSRSFCSEA